MKLFVDTNVIVDLIAKREPFWPAAQSLFYLVEDKAHQAFVSANTIATTSYLLGRYAKDKTIRSSLLGLRSFCSITAVDAAIVDRALATEAFTDIEDGIQYFSAIAAGCEVIITRDRTGFAASTLPVFDAKAFLALP